jgi:hypothetical protein
MAAVELQSFVTSQAGTQWRIDIYSETFAGATKEIQNQDFTIKFESEGDDITEPLKASTAVLMAYHRDDYDTEFDAFVTSLISSDENEYKMLVYKYVSGAFALDWAGNIIVDSCNYENVSNPRIFRITAVDGIGRLKNKPMAEAIADPSQMTTIADHIIDCLGYNDLAQFWGAGTAYLQESFAFYETSIGALAATESWLIRTRYSSTLNIKNLKNIDIRDTTRIRGWTRSDNIDTGVTVKDTDEPLTAYQVLYNIMRLFSCRIMLSGGQYRIQQIRNFDASSYTYREIDKAGAYVANGTINHQNTFGKADGGFALRPRSGGLFNWLQPLSEARVSNQNTLQASILKPSKIALDSSNTPQSRTIELGTIEGGTDKKLYFSWINIVNKLTVSGQNAGPKVTLSIKVQLAGGTGSSQYLSGTALKNSWSTNAASRVTIVIDNVQTGFEKLIEYASIISQLDIPTDTYTDCEIVVTATLTFKGASVTSTHFEYYMDHMAVTLSDGENFTSNIEYTVNNPSSTDNSTALDFGAIGLSDEGIITNLNAIEVDTGGGTWQQSSTWVAGYSTDVTLTKTIAHEAVALQRLPVKMLLQTVVGDYYAHLSVQYGSNTYVLNGGTYDVKNDEFNGEWFKIILNKTSIQTDKTVRGVEPGFGKIPDFYSAPKKYVKVIDDFKDFSKDLTDTTSAMLVSANPHTSISINTVGFAQIKNGDKLKIWDPQTQEIVQEVTVTADVTAVATSISVSSFSASADIPAGAQITHLPRELVTAECIRAEVAIKGTLRLDVIPGADHIANGMTTNGINAGYTTAIGDLMYLGSGGTWLEADASVVGTSTAPLLAIALEVKSSGSAILVGLPNSYVRYDTWTWTVGATLYASETLGAITETKPTAADTVVRVIGQAISADVIFFNPSSDHSTNQT